MSFTAKAPYQMFINGIWTDADSKEVFEVKNPATTEVVGTVPMGSDTDTTKALNAAQNAFKSWSRLPARKRGEYLEKVKDLLLENLQELAVMITLESGKPLSEAKGEVISAAENFAWYAAEARRVYGEVIPSDDAAKRIVVIRQAVGVAALITPWNFPLNILGRKVATALAAGCTIVAKPAEQTPITGILLWRLLEQAGLPPGVANLVTGDPVQIGKELLDNPIAKVIGFTGSTAVGKLLMQGASKHVKRLALELGGHAPFIVFEDADLDLAAKAVVRNKFRNTGQMCGCANRVYVHELVYDAFIEKLTALVQKLQVGNGLEDSTEVGPLVDEQGLIKVKQHVDDALSKGATALVGGCALEGSPGFFYQPTILVNVHKEMDIMREETFGPVVPVTTFTSEEEVLNQANDTQYGLYAYFFTKDADRSIRVSEALEYGMVGINDSLITAIQAPAGGFKESGLGREGGHWGMDEYLEVKYVTHTMTSQGN
ncbi:NAD-dependent succinate-semialdehyde dehydrogenase [Ferviditalea candida]|uniref:NAD-dependent succinate-semialdehyde dehydrogenase n=1 Tax=Ferviditalea candida TaxID=3108399 RepID=A0ABU5ZLK7_9BACL|nr:NAD-dependent succinate-semialdehyde dehydrogenase [Paenibacillaceae bacterium T2]